MTRASTAVTNSHLAQPAFFSSGARFISSERLPLSGLLAHHDTKDLSVSPSLFLYPPLSFWFFQSPLGSRATDFRRRVGYEKGWLLRAFSSSRFSRGQGAATSPTLPLSLSLLWDAHKDVITIITIIAVVIVVIVSSWTRAARKVVPDGDRRHFRPARPREYRVYEKSFLLRPQLHRWDESCFHFVRSIHAMYQRLIDRCVIDFLIWLPIPPVSRGESVTFERP